MIKGIGNNTRIVCDGYTGVDSVYLHGTPVVKVQRVGGSLELVTLNRGGYRTPTTKRRMNEVSDEWALGFKVVQKNFDWYVETMDGSIDFIDGMVFEVHE